MLSRKLFSTQPKELYFELPLEHLISLQLFPAQPAALSDPLSNFGPREYQIQPVTNHKSYTSIQLMYPQINKFARHDRTKSVK